MSAIPPGWLGSIIQTGGAERRAAANRAAESATDGDRASFADRLSDVIDSNDRDSQVYADAEGAGSQGRPFESGDGNATDETEGEKASEGGLDVEA